MNSSCQSYLGEQPLHVAIPWQSKIDPEGFSFPGEKVHQHLDLCPSPSIVSYILWRLGSVWSSSFGFPLFPGRSLRTCPQNILRSTISTVGGARAWAVLLAKTSRTAVPTAIMPIIAGGRLYKCLSKMHVNSRAFWGAFWGAFCVFLSKPG